MAGFDSIRKLQFGARDGCDVTGLCVFLTRQTDLLTVSVSIWRISTRITVRDLQLLGVPSKFHQIFHENGFDLFYFNKQ